MLTPLTTQRGWFPQATQRGWFCDCATPLVVDNYGDCHRCHRLHRDGVSPRVKATR